MPLPAGFGRRCSVLTIDSIDGRGAVRPGWPMSMAGITHATPRPSVGYRQQPVLPEVDRPDLARHRSLPPPLRPGTPLTCMFPAVGTGVDPVTSRFSEGISSISVRTELAGQREWSQLKRHMSASARTPD